MAEIINLREFRKARNRKSKSAKAARNRALHGRSEADTARERGAIERANDEIDGKRIERAARKTGDSETDEAE